MKQLIHFFVAALMATAMFSQNTNRVWDKPDPKHHIYFNGSFDLNKALKIKDNDRTRVDVFGFDYDLEAGIRADFGGVYMFYGAFQEMNWQNYGAGVDFYVNILERLGIDTSIGAAYSVVMRKSELHTDRSVWGSFQAYHVRGVVTIWIFDDIGLTGRFQYQVRPELPKKHGIFEGAIGITIKFDRS